MSRVITVGAAQLGPIARSESRSDVVKRLVSLLGQAHARACDLVVFPELALTTFFPRWWMEDQAEIDAFFEREMPGPETRPLWDEAADSAWPSASATPSLPGGRRRRGATTPRSWSTGPGASSASTARSTCPATPTIEPWRPFQHLEKRYFDVGDLGFPVWRALGGVLGMCICNDRRWPETYRVMGLQGVEMILLGYNTPVHNPPAPEHDLLGPFHNHLVMQAGAYQNGTWVVGVAKCGKEEGCHMIGQSAIIAPSGEIVALAATLGDELIVARCDLDLTRSFKETIFNFALHRRPEHYRLIVERAGAEPPPA